MKKYVITGGPGTGKTKVIELLSEHGYTIVPEVSRRLIEEKKRMNDYFSPLDNPKLFQEEVIRRQIEIETKLTEGNIFLDRGLIDNYGYSIYYNMPVSNLLEEFGRGRYDMVFLLDPLPSYTQDESRFEDRETALAIHDAIEEGYEEYGYTITKVPVMSPEERVDFIINCIQ